MDLQAEIRHTEPICPAFRTMPSQEHSVPCIPQEKSIFSPKNSFFSWCPCPFDQMMGNGGLPSFTRIENSELLRASAHSSGFSPGPLPFELLYCDSSRPKTRESGGGLQTHGTDVASTKLNRSIGGGDESPSWPQKLTQKLGEIPQWLGGLVTQSSHGEVTYTMNLS